jgi:hypothetical protein
MIINRNETMVVYNESKEEIVMPLKVASVYDQNPARIKLVANHRHNERKPVFKAFIGIQLMVGLVAAYFWNYLPN